MKKNASGNHRQTLRHSTSNPLQESTRQFAGRLVTLDDGARLLELTVKNTTLLLTPELQTNLESWLDELTTRRMQDPHQPWCDPAIHLLAEDAVVGPHYECVGRSHAVHPGTAGMKTLEGLWQQNPGEPDPHFFLEAGLSNWSLTVDEVRQAAFGLLSLEGCERAALLRITRAAVSDFDCGIPADELS